MPAYDIRSAIPLTPMTNPSDFPQYEYREYPKGMNMKADQAYVDAWMEHHKQIDDNSNKPYWPGGRPRVGSIVPILDSLRQPIFVQDEDEEREFRAEHPEAITIVSADTEMQELRAANERLQALLADRGGGDAADEFEKRLKALEAENAKLRGAAGVPQAEPEKEASGAEDDKAPARAPPKNGLPPRLK